MEKLTIIAHIKAEQDKIELVKQQLIKLIEPTRAEEGCINYDLHHDNTDATHFMFYENWLSRELWQKHMESDHISAYLVATEGSVAEFTLYEMTQTS